MTILFLKYEKNQIPSSGGVDALNDIYYLTDYLAGQPGWVAFIGKPNPDSYHKCFHWEEIFDVAKHTLAVL